MYPANAYNIRHATETDESALQRLAESDGRHPVDGPALVAEIGGKLAAAVSLVDGRVIADPAQQTTVARQVLRLRFGALRAYSRTPSLAERMREALAPFKAQNSEA